MATAIRMQPRVKTLAEKVSDHMQALYPDDTDAGGWICAEDHRDGTAVVVWRPGNTEALLPGGARAILIYRWHATLQNAGFVSNPRTDMEVYGRPGEESDDGRARWLHITGWDAGMADQRTTAELAHAVRSRVLGLAKEARDA